MVSTFLQLLSILVVAESTLIANDSFFNTPLMNKLLADPTNSFSYTATLHCEIPTAWCAEMFVFEVETLHIDDDPWHYVRVCSHNSTIELKLDTIHPGGDGLIDKHYEVGRIIYHNCTEKYTLSDYKCKLPTSMIRCPVSYMFDSDFNRYAYKCGCTAPELKTVYKDNAVLSEYIDLTNPPTNAYNSSDSDSCGYPTAFLRLNTLVTRFPYVSQPCLSFRYYKDMVAVSLNDFNA